MTSKTSTIIIVSVLSTIVLAGTSFAIYFAVKDQPFVTDHPDPDWSLLVSGNIEGDAYNITIAELLAMPQYEDRYTIYSSTNRTNNYTGIQLSYLFSQIEISPSAVNVTFIGIDGYAWEFSIDYIIGNETHILAHSKDDVYFDNYENGDRGYLYLLISPTVDYPFNAQRNVKNVVEIKFE